ncbi:MAG: hypothetical protein EHM61_04130 [Acidobacteria bacterium]|nr:MAG: hypothetical protein EHM61_04130 [Acidobacteriota bacterium]
MLKAHRLLIVPVAVFLLIPACSRKDETAPQAAAGGGFNPGKTADLSYQAPAEWVPETPSSRMRRAQYRLPRTGSDAEDAEMVVFYFPGQGGSVQRNIDRWIGMFTRADGTSASEAAKTDKKTVNGLEVTTVDVEGVYTNTGMGPMSGAAAPKPNYRMLAAIVETPGGPWFFKLTGPKETVGKWKPSFDQFVQTIKPS